MWHASEIVHAVPELDVNRLSAPFQARRGLRGLEFFGLGVVSRTDLREIEAAQIQRPTRGGPLYLGVPCGDLLSHGQSALSSALSRFTVLFGMGRGGTKTLWPQGVTCRAAESSAHAKQEEVKSGVDCVAVTGGVLWRLTGLFTSRLPPHTLIVIGSSRTGN